MATTSGAAQTLRPLGNLSAVRRGRSEDKPHFYACGIMPAKLDLEE